MWPASVLVTISISTSALIQSGRVWLTRVNRKQQMMIQSRELEALQQRIREAEERLKRQSTNYGSSSSTPQNNSGEQGQTAGKDGAA